MENEQSVTADGNTYFLRGDVVTKKHGNGEKIVGNPERIAFVKSAFVHEVKAEPEVVETLADQAVPVPSEPEVVSQPEEVQVEDNTFSDEVSEQDNQDPASDLN